MKVIGIHITNKQIKELKSLGEIFFKLPDDILLKAIDGKCVVKLINEDHRQRQMRKHK